MIKLTDEEKANRYDAIVCAIGYTVGQYQKRIDEIDECIRGKDNLSDIEKFNYGQSTALRGVIDDLMRWL